MYQNTTYKAFVAETAAKVAAEISGAIVKNNGTDYPFDKDIAEEISFKAVLVADKLADKLDDWWQLKGEHQTVMFDVQDSLTSNIERELSGIAENISSIVEEMQGGMTVNVNENEEA
jgi:hypothetical protein